jgi:hypothetical protein
MTDRSQKERGHRSVRSTSNIKCWKIKWRFYRKIRKGKEVWIDRGMLRMERKSKLVNLVGNTRLFRKILKSVKGNRHWNIMHKGISNFLKMIASKRTRKSQQLERRYFLDNQSDRNNLLNHQKISILPIKRPLIYHLLHFPFINGAVTKINKSFNN